MILSCSLSVWLIYVPCITDLCIYRLTLILTVFALGARVDSWIVTLYGQVDIIILVLGKEHQIACILSFISGDSWWNSCYDDSKTVVFAGLEALAVVKGKLLVVTRYYFVVDVWYAWFKVWHGLWMTLSCENSGMQKFTAVCNDNGSGANFRRIRKCLKLWAHRLERRLARLKLA
jgi:hypothetical protein